VQILTKVANFDALMKKIKTYSSKKTVYNALCQHFLKARAPNQGLEPFLSPSKIAKRLEPSSPEPRIRSTTTPDPLLLSAQQGRATDLVCSRGV
jgi:hypothetical protein